MNRKQGLSFVLLCLIWGSTWIASDAVGQKVPALLAASVRCLFSAACLFPFLLRRRLPRFVFGQVVPLAATMIVFPLVLLDWARPRLPSATVTVLFAAMPLITFLFRPEADSGNVQGRVIGASALATGGLAAALSMNFSAQQALPAAVVLGAVVSAGASALLAQRAVEHAEPAALAAYVSGVAGLLLAVCSLLWERGQPVQWSGQTLLLLILLGSVGGAVAYAVWFRLLSQVPAYQAVSLNWAVPLVAFGESALFLRILPSSPAIGGSLVTLGCLLVVAQIREEDNKNVSFRGI